MVGTDKRCSSFFLNLLRQAAVFAWFMIPMKEIARTDQVFAKRTQAA
jgi:hypothetical protein